MLDLRCALKMKQLRQAQGTSQMKFAEDIGVSRPGVSMVERGNVTTVKLLDEYVTALLGVTLSDILFEKVVEQYVKLQAVSGVQQRENLENDAQRVSQGD